MVFAREVAATLNAHFFFTENNSNQSRTAGYSMCCMDYFGVVLHGLMLSALYCVWYGAV